MTLKTLYINLDRCKKKNTDMIKKFPDAFRIPGIDGNNLTPEDILPYKSDKNWRDPYYNRRATKGEVGCILSHMKAWEQCVALNEPVIILEDDVEVKDPSYLELVELYAKDYDFLYLSKKVIEGQPEKINEHLETNVFSYWACAYFIQPAVARALLAYFTIMPLIPTDEILPAILGVHRWENLNRKFKFKSAAFTANILEPFAGAFDVSETESIQNIWEDYNMHIITVATDESKATKLLSSNPDIINLGKGVVWEGGTMEGPGGGQKINLVKAYLEDLPDNDIVMFSDGYDTFIDADKKEILKRYFGMTKEVVFAAEETCWPDTRLASSFQEPEVGYRYLNSGCYIGTVKELKRIFAPDIENWEDDQLYVQKQYLTGKYDMVLDHESYLFCCLAGIENKVTVTSKWIVNQETNCTTCVIHGNGGEYTKGFFDSLYAERATEIEFVDLGNDIFVLKNLFSKKWCADLIAACEEKKDWEQLPNDLFPAQEIRLNTLLEKRFTEHFEQVYANTIVPQIEAYWPKLKMHGIRDLFAIKYSPETQSSLELHHDMSLVSATIKLSNDYEGAVLDFPRQNINNSTMEVGDAIFWPAQVTHPHQSLPITKGTKYSLVLWTARYAEDPRY
jgi:hypothetical protein